MHWQTFNISLIILVVLIGAVSGIKINFNYEERIEFRVRCEQTDGVSINDKFCIKKEVILDLRD
jgi:hypothetical protein